MEKEDLLPDDLLRDFFSKQTWESPSDGFTESVMGKIILAPEAVTAKKPFYLILRSSWPFALLFIVTLVFLMTSDLPFTGYIPGKEYFTKNLLPYLDSIFSGFKSFFTNSKTVSIPLMIIIAGTLLVGLDHFLFRKPDVRHQTSR